MLAITYASLLDLLRDRGALVMAFVLPVVIFVIFAAVFSGTQGSDLDISIAFSDESDSEAGRALGGELASATEIRFAPGAAPIDRLPAQEARARASDGTVDAAIIVVSDPAALAAGIAAAPPIVVFADEAKPIAGAVAAAAAQQALAAVVPGAVGPPRISIETAGAAEAREPAITYYAGAIAIMFLFFAALQSAVALIEDRDSGIVDRLMLTRGGAGALIAGKYLFLVGLGVAQALAVFAAAWVGYGVEFWRVPLPFLMTTGLAAAASAGLALAVVCAASTRAQALAAGNAIVLVISAIGGSMVPRYLMPQWLQDLGAFTPSAWVIEAYQDILWRGLGAADVALLWALIGLFAVSCLVFGWVSMKIRDLAV